MSKDSYDDYSGHQEFYVSFEGQTSSQISWFQKTIQMKYAMTNVAFFQYSKELSNMVIKMLNKSYICVIGVCFRINLF